MNSMSWLMAANMVVWLGLGAYVVFLAQGQRKLQQRLRLKEMMDNE